MIIDVHAHYYPKAYLQQIGRPELPPRLSADLGDQNIEQRLALLNQTGIDTQVLSVSQAQPYLPISADAATAAALVNDLYADLCCTHPGRFYTFAALPLPHIPAALDEIARVFRDSTVVGVTIGCSVAGRQLDDPLFEPIFDELNRRKTTVFLHPIGQEQLSWLSGHNLAWLVGAPFEDTLAALRLVLSGVVRRHPHITFIVPHLGGTLPFLMARILRKHQAGDLADDFQKLYYDTVSGSVSAARCACDVFTPDRLLFGTDYPYCSPQEFQHHLRYLDEVGLNTAQLDAIRGRRAQELLGLPAAP